MIEIEVGCEVRYEVLWFKSRLKSDLKMGEVGMKFRDLS